MKKKIAVVLILAIISTYAVNNGNMRCFAVIKTVKLKKYKVTMRVGEYYKLKLIEGKSKIRWNRIKWKSQNKRIVKVNKKGKVVAEKSGIARVLVVYKGKKHVCIIRVKKRHTETDAKYTSKEKREFELEKETNDYTIIQSLSKAAFIAIANMGKLIEKNDISVVLKPNGEFSSKSLNNSEERKFVKILKGQIDTNRVILESDVCKGKKILISNVREKDSRYHVLEIKVHGSPLAKFYRDSQGLKAIYRMRQSY